MSGNHEARDLLIAIIGNNLNHSGGNGFIKTLGGIGGAYSGEIVDLGRGN